MIKENIHNPGNWIGVHIPKFRTASRALRFAKKYRYNGRLPERSELVFLKSDASTILAYSKMVGRLSLNFEEKILESKNYDVIFYYVSAIIKERNINFENILIESPLHLVRYVKWCKSIGCIFTDIELSNFENNFLGDTRAVYEYSEMGGRLPEILHNFMIMNGTDNYHSARYISNLKSTKESLYKDLKNYVEDNNVDVSITIGDFLNKMKYGY